MNGGNSGSFNRPMYDTCAFEQEVASSTGPFEYMMYQGKYESCQKCVENDKQVWRPFDGDVVDRESELKGISRRISNCAQYKYNPSCKKSSGYCTSTFDPSNPIVMPPEACPIINNNLKRPTNPGYVLKTDPWCEQPKFRYPN